MGRNQFPSSLVNKTVKQYLSNFFVSPLRASAETSSNEISTHYYKLPFVGPFSTEVQHRVKRLTQRYKVVFAPYKIKNLFSAKDAIPKLSPSRVVYKFSCVGCSACYVDESNWHLATRVREHLTSDKNSHIFQDIYGLETCRALCSENCYSILDTAASKYFQLKIKEALHKWQVNHVNLTLSF